MIYLVRHGETEWNRLRLLQGHTDIPLSEEGAQQIRSQGLRLREMGFRVDRVATSSLKRASQTARVLTEAMGYTGPIMEDDELKERYFGSAEGLSLREPLNVNDPKYGAETLEALQVRIAKVLEKYQQNPNEDWLLVTHGGFIKATLAMLSKAAGQENYSFLPIHGDPICLFDRDGKFVGHYILGEEIDAGKNG